MCTVLADSPTSLPVMSGHIMLIHASKAGVKYLQEHDDQDPLLSSCSNGQLKVVKRHGAGVRQCVSFGVSRGAVAATAWFYDISAWTNGQRSILGLALPARHTGLRQCLVGISTHVALLSRTTLQVAASEQYACRLCGPASE